MTDRETPALSDRQAIFAHENTALDSDIINEARFSATNPLPAGASAVVVTYTLPQGMLGIVRAIALQTPSLAQLTSIRWQLRINRKAVLGLDNILGPMATFLLPKPVLVRLNKNDTVDIFATNISAADIPVWGMINGHQFVNP